MLQINIYCHVHIEGAEGIWWIFMPYSVLLAAEEGRDGMGFRKYTT